MKKYIRCQEDKIPHYSDLFDKIDAIVIAPDIDIPYDKYHINVTAASDVDLPNFSSFSKRRLAHLAKTRPSLVQKITDYHALINLMDLVNDFGLAYEFTDEQYTILEESFAGRSLFKDVDAHPDSATTPVTLPISMYDVERVLKMLRKCEVIAMPDPRTDTTKNFANCHDYDMVEADYLGIIKEIKGSELRTKSRSYDLRDDDYYMNYIFEFIHPGNDYQLLSGQIVDDYIDIYIKLVFDYAEDTVIAVVSFHDPKYHKGISSPAFPDYESLNEDVKYIAEQIVAKLDVCYQNVPAPGDIKISFRLNTCGIDTASNIFIEVLDPFDDKLRASVVISSEYDLSEDSDYYIDVLYGDLTTAYDNILVNNS